MVLDVYRLRLRASITSHPSRLDGFTPVSPPFFWSSGTPSSRRCPGSSSGAPTPPSLGSGCTSLVFMAAFIPTCSHLPAPHSPRVIPSLLPAGAVTVASVRTKSALAGIGWAVRQTEGVAMCRSAAVTVRGHSCFRPCRDKTRVPILRHGLPATVCVASRCTCTR